MSSNITTLREVAFLTPGYAFKSVDFGEYENKVIKIGDILPETICESLSGVNILSYPVDKLEKYLCRRGDYLVAMTGNTIGKVGRIVSGKAYANQRVLKVSAITDVLDPGYLWGILSSSDFYNHIISHIDSHSAQPNISASSIGSFVIELPKLEKQQQASSVLMRLEKKIELNNRINDYLAA